MSELITLIEIDQPFCTRTYGESPCTAALGITGTAKCYNTRATCQDPANYQAEDITLRFCKTSQQLQDYGYCVPAISSVSMTPMKINLGGMDQDSRAFGNRERVSISAVDLKSSDYVVDKYQDERDSGGAGDPYSPYDTGTYWGKWIARNPFYEGYPLRVIQGTTDQSLAQMEARHYIIDRISGPSDGSVSIVAKDVFSKVESRKSKAPAASRGDIRNGFDELHSGLIHLIPGGIGDIDYPTGEFWVAINDEAILVERNAGFDSLKILERGGLGTQAEEHESADKVQVILAYESQRAHVIVADLLTEYAGVDPALINMAEWDAAMADRPELLTGYVAEPEAVETLVGEIAEQIGFTIWPSVTENKINLKVLTAGDSPSVTVDDDAWMIEGSYSGRRMINQRVSQVWVYYGQRNPIESLDDPANYHSRRVFADLEAEGDEFYGQSSIKEIYSRWIPQFAGTFAATAGSRILSLFRDPPLRVSFDLHRTRDGALSLAQPFELNTRDNQSETGANLPVNLVPIELVRSQERIEVLAQQLRFFSTPADDRTLTIEGDTFNFNIRQAFEALFGAPNPGDEIVVQVFPNVTVGSVDPSQPAMETGGFPEGVILRIELATGARIIGAGGNGGDVTGSDGQDAGIGLLLNYPAIIENNGLIAGGGGGGGGAFDDAGGGDTAQAAGGGGAGVTNGTGHQDGTDTIGGEGGYQEVSIGGNIEPIILIADGGKGGNLGQPGLGGFASLTPDGIGEGGKAGAAIDGGGSANIITEGQILGEVKVSEATELDPPAAAVTNLVLESELIMTSTTDYAITLRLQFDDPEDDRIAYFEAEYRLARFEGAWRSVYRALSTSHEWNVAEIGQHQVRVRPVYRGSIIGPWAYATNTNLGTFETLSEIGLADPDNPLLFITTNPEKSTAEIRIESGYPATGPQPDRFLLMYSVATAPATMITGQDTGDRIYLNASETVVGEFSMPVVSGGTASRIFYDRPAGVDVNTVGGWWINIFSPGNPHFRYFKVSQASNNELVLNPGNEFPFVPSAGDNVNVAELDWADGRLPEFKLAYIDGEVIRHNGIGYDEASDRYYLDVIDRAAEGSSQALHPDGSVLHYYPAPGPLTNIIEIPTSEFQLQDDLYVFSGSIPVDIPPNMVWASVTCAVARKASSNNTAAYIRSNIVPLTIAGPV